MIKDFPEGHFAIAMNAINDSEWHTSSIQKIEELNKKRCQTFYALLRDHGGFAPTTLGILMNRWGIIEPPNFQIMDHLFFANLINHISSSSNTLSESLASTVMLFSSLFTNVFHLSIIIPLFKVK